MTSAILAYGELVTYQTRRRAAIVVDHRNHVRAWHIAFAAGLMLWLVLG